MSPHIGWLEASVVGLLQGVSELFPVSSLGHSILIPAIIGGSWAKDLSVSTPESPYLAFIVGLHVATALALVVYFWRDWLRIITGLITSVRYRRISNPNERLAWRLILATIPVGLVGLFLEHAFRTLLAKPNPTAVFLIVNGALLLAVERYAAMSRNKAADLPVAVGTAHGSTAAAYSVAPNGDAPHGDALAIDNRLAALSIRDAVLIGCAQIAALCPGISRSGITMGAGLLKGLDREDAARFSFLLATPVILAAGVLKIGDLAGPLGNGIRGQVLLGSALSFIGAYVSVRFLSRYFQSNSLRPFGFYCLAFGAISLVLVNR